MITLIKAENLDNIWTFSLPCLGCARTLYRSWEHLDDVAWCTVSNKASTFLSPFVLRRPPAWLIVANPFCESTKISFPGNVFLAPEDALECYRCGTERMADRRRGTNIHQFSDDVDPQIIILFWISKILKILLPQRLGCFCALGKVLRVLLLWHGDMTTIHRLDARLATPTSGSEDLADDLEDSKNKRQIYVARSAVVPRNHLYPFRFVAQSISCILYTLARAFSSERSHHCLRIWSGIAYRRCET